MTREQAQRHIDYVKRLGVKPDVVQFVADMYEDDIDTVVRDVVIELTRKDPQPK